MELKTAGTTTSTQKKIYVKPRIEIVNLVADEMVLGFGTCQTIVDAAIGEHCQIVVCKTGS